LHDHGGKGPRIGLWITDLFFREGCLLVEYDGDHHRTDRAQFATDVRRSSNLTAAGYAQLRFTAADLLGRPDTVVATVSTTLKSRGVRW
jgi:very-short-patch-repair endonuclease